MNPIGYKDRNVKKGSDKKLWDMISRDKHSYT